MKKMKVLAICAIAVLSITSAKAQFATGADIVSGYVWRGVDQAGGTTPNIQPYASFTAENLQLVHGLQVVSQEPLKK